MPATVPITTFSGAAPPWSLLSLDANFAGIAAALANPQIGVSQSADSGGVNALIATPSPAWTAYTSGTLITVTPANTNTGNTTLNVNGLGTRSVLNPDGSQLLPGALQAGTPYLFMCSTSTFVLLGSSFVQATQGPGGTPFALRNRLINGDFRVDQRNPGVNGVPVTNNGGIYTVDRWLTACSLGAGTGSISPWRVSTAPIAMGNQYALYHSVGTAKSVLAAADFCFLEQRIEGLNVEDLLWGTASAKSITISFTFQTSIANAVLPVAINNAGSSRSYVTSITTGAANTAARYSVTVPGDTTGSWAVDSTNGFQIIFTWGAGSTYQTSANTWTALNFVTVSGATNFLSSISNSWYITDIQIEAGTVATPFERIGFDMQLARCMRYFEKSYDYGIPVSPPSGANFIGNDQLFLSGLASAANQFSKGCSFKVQKRTAVPPVIYSPNTSASGKVRDAVNSADVTATVSNVATTGFDVGATMSAGSTSMNFNWQWTDDAEL